MTNNPKTHDVTLALLRSAIQGEDEGSPFDIGHIDADTWKDVMELSIAQGVTALCYDSLEKLQCECLPPKDILLTWFGLAMQVGAGFLIVIPSYEQVNKTIYMVKISIITVTFNRAHVIRDAIEGVLRQKYKNYEYIIVDGASKDNTLDILKEYEPKFDGRMRWISEPDKGLYDAINKGIRMATGDVVGIINSDDFFHRDDTFDVIAEAFEDDNTDAIYTDDEEINEKTGKRFRFNGGNFKTWQYRIGMMPSHPTFYAKKELFEKYGYYKLGYKIAADFELMMRFAYVNKVKMKYVPEAIMTFRLGGVSTNLKNKMLLNKETVRALRENGLFACAPMIWIKYLFKINQIIHSI